MEKSITVREAAREADVSNQHITRLINDKVLKAEKFGFQYAIDRTSFDAWLLATGRKKPEQGSQGETEQSDQGEPADRAEARAHA